MLRRIQQTASFFGWLLVASTAFFVGVSQVNPTNESSTHWVDFVSFVKNNQLWFLPGPPVVAVALQWLASFIEKHRSAAERRAVASQRVGKLKTLMSRLLRLLQPQFIPSSMRKEPETFHRLTVFKANDAQETLAIFARSSEATADSGTTWAIHPDIEARCEGIAAAAWFLNTTIVVPDKGERPLPDVSSPDATNAEIEDYASRTLTSPDLVRQSRWRARSYAAMTLRTRDGRKWGVLVLDSVATDGVTLRRMKEKKFTSEMLGDIITVWSEL